MGLVCTEAVHEVLDAHRPRRRELEEIGYER